MLEISANKFLEFADKRKKKIDTKERIRENRGHWKRYIKINNILFLSNKNRLTNELVELLAFIYEYKLKI